MANDKTLQIRCKEETVEKFNEFAKRLGFKQGEVLAHILEIYEKYDRAEPNYMHVGLSRDQYYLLEDAIGYRIFCCERDVESSRSFKEKYEENYPKHIDDDIKEEMAEIEEYKALQKHLREARNWGCV